MSGLVYAAIKAAGEKYGIVDFGMRAPALHAARKELSHPGFASCAPSTGPFEGGMERFVKLEKNHFIGREAAASEHADGPKLRRVSFIVDALDADVMGDEPIWARVGDRDFGTVENPHGYGAPRFGTDGAEIAHAPSSPLARAEGIGSASPDSSRIRGIRDGAWAVVGWVTSGGYAHFVEQSMAQGYVPAETGDRRKARASSRLKFSASAARPASMSIRSSIRRARACGLDRAH